MKMLKSLLFKAQHFKMYARR